MSRVHPLPVVALLVAAVASAAVGTQTKFATSVDLVALDVCATDHTGRPAQINADQLAVCGNGICQQISLFSPGDRVPLAVTLLLDSSQSMYHGLLDQATAAATALIDQLPTDSLVEVTSFNDHTSVLYPMGGDRRQAALALSDVSPIGGTALYKAMLVAIRGQQRAERARHDSYREVIVMLTDGENTERRVEFDDVLDEARRSRILMYPVVLPPHDAPGAARPGG